MSSRPDSVMAVMVGEYSVGPKIGQGSFAIVYKGYHKVTKEPVAIKAVLRHKLTKKLLENLESEINILKLIEHNHIVQLVDCKKTESHIHLIMEFCSMGDLSTYIKRQRIITNTPTFAGFPKPITAGGLPEIVARHFLKQLASALQFLRSKNLIHRDIKPQNLLLVPPPEGNSGHHIIGLPYLPTLKVADFGFARSLPSHSLAETLCGSPLYMAPEILRYEKYDAKADLWSVGAVLYQMIAGRPPFRAENHVELLRKIEKKMDRIKFPGDHFAIEGTENGLTHIIIPGSSTLVSEDIKDVIRHLLKRNPIERISFEEFFNHHAVVAKLESTPAQIFETSLASATANDIRNIAPMSNPTTPSRRDQYEIPPFAQYVVELPFATQPRDRRPQAIPSSKRSETSPAYISPTRTTSTPRDFYPGGRPHSFGGTRDLSPLSPREPVRRNMDTLDPADAGLTNAMAVAQALTDNRLSHPSSQPSSPTDGKRYDLLLPQDPTSRVSRRASEDNYSPPGSIYIQQNKSINRSVDTDDDVYVEREYVIVNRDAVAANAFADEVAASPRINSTSRRSNQPSSNVTPPSSTYSPFAFGTPSPYNYNHSSQSPTNASYFYGTTPPFAIPNNTPQEKVPSIGIKSGKSDLARALTMVWNRLGSGKSNRLIVFGNDGGDPEEDTVIKDIEDMACKAYAIFTFAEGKFLALFPPPPSAPNIEQEMAAKTPEEDSRLAGEALVLYLKALALLQSGMDVAKDHWAKISQKAETGTTKMTFMRLNIAVQWIRDRFNECLERAELTKSKCPPDDAPQNVSMEMLVYYRALEISQTAAKNELAGDDLSSCEKAYQNAIWMLEALLDTRSQTDSELMVEEDEKTIRKILSSVNNRLTLLRKKAEAQLNVQPSNSN